MRPDPNVVLFICFVLAALVAAGALLVVIHLDRRLTAARRRAQLAEHASLRWQHLAQGHRRASRPVSSGDITTRLARVEDELAPRRRGAR